MNRGKCPGSDGLSVEFYSKFWHLVEGPLLAALTTASGVGKLSTEQCRGIITLIPKKGVDRRRVENWRPITLLNVDYKLFTKVHAIRLQSCIGEVIHSDQTGFMRGRYIGVNVRTIADVVDFTRSSGSQGWLLGCDFSKAFDMVSSGLERASYIRWGSSSQKSRRRL